MPQIEIPLKCISYNSYYRIYRGHYCISSEGRIFRDDMELHLNELLADNKPTNKKIKLTIHCYFEKNYRRDCDNLGKSVLDCLTHSKLIYLDDSQIYDLRILKYNNEKQNKIVIEWEVMD